MKQKIGIRWKEAAGNQRNRESSGNKILGFVIDVIHSTLCTVVFMVSTQMMLKDVFHWGSITFGNTLRIILFSFLLSGIMEISYYAKKWSGIGIRWGTLLLGGAGFIWYVNKGHLEAIVNGTLSMAYSYINIWNGYYETYLVVPMGRESDVNTALDFIMLVLLFLLLWRARLQRKNLWLGIAPAFALCLALLVGYVPGEKAIFLTVLGIFLANATSWKYVDFVPNIRKKKSRIKGTETLISGILVLCLTFLLGFCVKNFGKESATKFVENPEKMIAFQQKVEDEIAQFDIWNLFNGYGDSGIEKLSNNTPEYDNEPVLGMEIQSKPLGNIYLKGYYADTYEDGIWKRELDTFEKACQEAGFDSELVSQELANLGIDKLKGTYLIGSTGDYYGITTKVSYLASTGTRAFFPYFVDVENKDIFVEGDSRFTKGRKINEVSFGTWYYESEYQQMLSKFEAGERREWEDWYENYVLEQYLKVPNNLINVKMTAAMVGEMRYVEDIFGNIDMINEYRLATAYQVRDWLRMNTSYNLELPDLPKDTDPVEYFLKSSRSGYCMHYATAAVLMLREMGVPARYASGYVVNNNAFRENDWGYEVIVQDNRAHAWAEIYLNGIGWVPVEVTKGYESGTIQESIDKIQNISSESQMESEDLNDLPEDSSLSQSQEESEASQTQSQAPEESLRENNGNGTNNQKPKSTPWGNFSLLILGIGAIIALVGFLILKWKKAFQKKLIKEIRRKRTKRAIKTMNRRIYKKLRLTGKSLKQNLTDEEYATVLRKTYPEISQEDWTQYMAIVKAAAFSKKDFSWEEMEFCYKIYQKIIKNS